MKPLISPRLITFNTEKELHDHAEKLNIIGVSPDVPVIDSRGYAMLASRTAPGGDDWGFAYHIPSDDGLMHCCGCSECGPKCGYRNPGWKPFFPVTALVAYDVSDVEC